MSELPLVISPGGDLARDPPPDILDEAAASLRAAAKSEAIRRAYRSDTRDFVT